MEEAGPTIRFHVTPPLSIQTYLDKDAPTLMPFETQLYLRTRLYLSTTDKHFVKDIYRHQDLSDEAAYNRYFERLMLRHGFTAHNRDRWHQ